MTALVDIIIPVWNRPEHTEQTILSLYENTNKDDYNLHIVNDNSNVETFNLLNEMDARMRESTGKGFELLNNQENLGPGGCRTEMAKRITKRSKYVYFSDNDVYFKEGWLELLLGIYERVSKLGVCLLGASCHPYLQNNDVIKPFGGSYKVGLKDAVSGYSHFMTWEIYDRFGPYVDQKGMEKKTGQSEDWKLCQDIIKEGFKVGSVEPELIIPTGATDSYGDEAVGIDTFKKFTGVKVI